MEAKREYLRKKLETNQLEANMKFADYPDLLKNRLEYLQLRYDLNIARLDKSDSEPSPVKKEKTPHPKKAQKIQIKVEAPKKRKEKKQIPQQEEAVMSNIL